MPDFTDQLTGWLSRANARTTRTIQSLGGDALPDDLAAITRLPPVPPRPACSNRCGWHGTITSGWTGTTTPCIRVIGRPIDVTAILDGVIVVCDGCTVADRQRGWASNAVVTDPAHVQTVRGLHSQLAAPSIRGPGGVNLTDPCHPSSPTRRSIDPGEQPRNHVSEMDSRLIPLRLLQQFRARTSAASIRRRSRSEAWTVRRMR